MNVTTDKIRENTFYVFICQMAVKPLAIVTFIILTRRLTREDLGMYNMLMGASMGFVYITNGGILGALQRFIPEFLVKKQHNAIVHFSKLALVANLALAGTLSLAAYLSFDHWAHLVKLGPYKDAFLVFLIFISLSCQSDILMLVLNNTFLSKFRMLSFTGYSALKLALILILSNRLSTFRLFVVELLCIIPLLFSYAWFIGTRFLPAAERGGTGKMDYRRFFRYALFSAGTGPGYLLYDYSTDFIVIGHFRALADVGLYSFAARISRMMVQLLPQNVLQTVVRPVFYAKFAEDEGRKRLGEMFNALGKTNLFVLLPAFCFLLVNGKPFISHVFDPKWLDAYPILVVMAGFACLTFFELGTDLTIQAVERIQYSLYGQAFALLNLLADILLLKHGFGLMSVALATGSAVLTRNLFLYCFARKFGGIRFEWASYARIAANSLVALAVMFAISRATRGWTQLALSGGVGAFAYLAMTAFCSPFHEKEKQYLGKISGFVNLVERIRKRPLA